MRRLFLVSVGAVLVGMGPAIFAAESAAGSKNKLVSMNFENVDISVLAQFISRITGKNIVLDDGVSGKVSVIAPAKVTPAQAFCIFESALQLKGFAAVKAGPVIKIVPSRDARSYAPVTRSATPAGECAQPISPNA
jgi:general secretion pathway protein D